MILYKIVDNIEETKKCDDLLTKLIMSERKYDDNVKETYKVKKNFTEIHDKIIMIHYEGTNIWNM